MIRIAACDDSPYQLDKICKVTQDYLKLKKQEYILTQFNMLKDLQDQLLIGNFEILLLDIQFDAEKTTSLEFVQKLTSISPDVQIIFITNYMMYFPDVYLCNHIYCILKDELEKRLPKALEKALKNLNKKKNILTEDALHIVMNRHAKVIQNNEIYYLEKDRRKIIFHCRDIKSYFTSDELKSKKTPVIDPYGSFDDYLPLLPEYFVQTHRSYIVNLNYVKSVQGNDLLLLNEDIIPISRNYKKNTMNVIAKLFFHTED